MGLMQVAIILLHPGCNMVCDFCVTEDPLGSMTFEEAVTLLRHLKEKGIANVVFGGGEPFDWKNDLIALTAVAKEMGFFVQIGTNGVALPPHFESIPTIDRFVLPLDSADPEIHNRLRRYRNRHHSIILDRLRILREAHQSVTVSTVVTRENLTHLKEIGLFLKAYYQEGGLLHAWHLYQFLPEGRGGYPNAGRLAPTQEDYHRTTDEVKRMELGFTVYKRPNMYQSKTVGFFSRISEN